jgi:signal transduction histidine kinase
MGTASSAERAGVLPSAAELVARIGWLIRLRWLAVVGVTCFLEAARRIFPLDLALGPLYATIGGLAAYNLVLSLIYLKLRRGASLGLLRRVGGLAILLLPHPPRGVQQLPEALQAALFASLQIAIDLLFLALLLHFSGGIDNPFQLFFIFHVIVASILLSRRATYFHATLGLALVSALALGEYFGLLRHYPLYSELATGYRDPALVGARLSVLGATLYLSAYMATTIASQLRAREHEVFHLSRKLAEKATLLEAAYRRVKDSERAKSQYMRKVAHELRGPLGTVQTALKVVLQGLAGEIATSSRDLVTRAERRAGELAQVTQDLLSLSRAREGGFATEMVPVEPAKLVGEVVEEQSEAAKRAGVAVNVDVPPDLGSFKADPAGLEQLIGNLVSNAIRYTPAGGRVDVRLAQAGDQLRFEVEDTGIGVAAEDLPRLFEEFYRAANAREFAVEGTGLGLSIVKAVAEEHGGSVSIESQPGHGTRVSVLLPLKQVARPAA